MKKSILIAATIFASIASYANDNVETETNKTTVSTPTITSTEAVENPAPSSFGEQDDDAFNYDRKISAITEVGTTFLNDKAFFNIYQAVGARVNPYLFIGAGLGLQVRGNQQYQYQLLADVRANILNKRVTPVLLMQVGLNKVGPEILEKSEKDALKGSQLNLNLGTGILIKATDNASFTINGGYSLFSDFTKNKNGGFVKIGYVF
jgi:hypothetical protein